MCRAGSRWTEQSQFCRTDTETRRCKWNSRLNKLKHTHPALHVYCNVLTITSKRMLTTAVENYLFCAASIAFSAFTLLFGHQKEHPACKNSVMRCWCGYLSGARCRLFAYGPADATASQNPIISGLI